MTDFSNQLNIVDYSLYNNNNNNNNYNNNDFIYSINASDVRISRWKILLFFQQKIYVVIYSKQLLNKAILKSTRSLYFISLITN